MRERGNTNTHTHIYTHSAHVRAGCSARYFVTRVTHAWGRLQTPSTGYDILKMPGKSMLGVERGKTWRGLTRLATVPTERTARKPSSHARSAGKQRWQNILTTTAKPPTNTVLLLHTRTKCAKLWPRKKKERKKGSGWVRWSVGSGGEEERGSKYWLGEKMGIHVPKDCTALRSLWVTENVSDTGGEGRGGGGGIWHSRNPPQHLQGLCSILLVVPSTPTPSNYTRQKPQSRSDFGTTLKAESTRPTFVELEVYNTIQYNNTNYGYMTLSRKELILLAVCNSGK